MTICKLSGTARLLEDFIFGSHGWNYENYSMRGCDTVLIGIWS